MKYVILGKTGYIAQAIIKELANRNIKHVTLSKQQVDYTNYRVFENFLSRSDLFDGHISEINVINCAGYIGKPNVDACEDKIEETMLGNVMLPKMLMELSTSQEFKFTHISSGCIYNGYDKRYTEDCPSDFDFSNGSMYSGTKNFAEKIIRDISDLHYIFRLRIPFDHYKSPRNYITKMLSYNKLLDAENSMSNRQDFAKAVIDLLELRVPYGTYNITNPGSMSTSQVVELIKEHIAPDREYKFFKDLDQFYKHARAPRSNCVLDTSKIENLIKIKPLHDSMEQSIMKYT